MNPSAIYIHVPFCRRRCTYCNFYFEVGKPASNFADALFLEWQARAKDWTEPASSLYFGGGTPSMLKASEINKIVAFFKNEGMLQPNAEITLEANPEDINVAFTDEIRSGGINRLSLGVQSFDDDMLKFLGRKHREYDAKKAIETALSGGFNNISVDMIIGSVGENPKHTHASINYLSERVPHISAYLLTIEEGTHLYKRIKKGQLSEAPEDHQVDMFRMVQEQLLERGFIQYDISSYAKEGFFSRHNQIYWAMGSYLGLGPSAHSMRFLADGGVLRWANEASVQQWLQEPQSDLFIRYDQLSPDQALKEALAFGLRNMSQGIDAQKLALRHQVALPKDFAAAIEKLKLNGYLEEKNQALRISKNGALFADAIMREILCS